MWTYEKKLTRPIRIIKTDSALAQALTASLKKQATFALNALAFRYGMHKPCHKALLTDIFTECLNNLEMFSSLLHQLSDEPLGDLSLRDVRIYTDDASAETALSCLMLCALNLKAACDTALRAADEGEAVDVLRFLSTRADVHYGRLKEALYGI